MHEKSNLFSGIDSSKEFGWESKRHTDESTYSQKTTLAFRAIYGEKMYMSVKKGG